jgi:hypothetical protein
MLPATGSTMMPAISSGCALKASATSSRSLYESTSVSLAMAAGTPADEGWPKVNAPEPAFTSKLSPWP